MAVRNYSNITNVGTLSGAVGTSEATLAINGGWSNLPSFPFYVIVGRGTANEECMLATGGNAAALQVTRGYDGSPASSHGIGSTIEHAVLAEFFNKADAHVEASTNVHGLSGGAAVVGTSQAQTLTNKTINSSVVSVAHSTSPSASQAVQVAADAATARDGFVWTKTASATGAAFKATSGGTTRFTVDADGKVQLNSATASDKALSVTESGTERLFIQNDGHADFGLQAVGATTDRVRIRAQGTQNALAIKDSGGFNTLTIGGSGNVDASGYLATAGNLTVTGTSNLTGALTMPLLGAGGAQSRIITNARSGDNLYEGKGSGGTTTFVIRDTGRIQSWNHGYLYDGSQPIVAKVSSTAVVVSPPTGMFVIDDSDGFIKRYNGSSWDALVRINSGLHARYIATTPQTFSFAVAAKLNFPTAVTTTGDVSVASNNTFTLNRAGLWMIEATVGWAGAASNTYRTIQIANGAGTARYAESSAVTNGGGMNNSASTVRMFSAGDTISIFAYHEHGANLDTSVTSENVHVSLTWLRA